ncbi:hypothetical protein B0H13DRAFT_1886203 [Mycena leptocephala]|nr:hypothetical protein B0H13DRAFT_1886203 [Mycena leptocephala]
MRRSPASQRLTIRGRGPASILSLGWEWGCKRPATRSQVFLQTKAYSLAIINLSWLMCAFEAAYNVPRLWFIGGATRGPRHSAVVLQNSSVPPVSLRFCLKFSEVIGPETESVLHGKMGGGDMITELRLSFKTEGAEKHDLLSPPMAMNYSLHIQSAEAISWNPTFIHQNRPNLYVAVYQGTEDGHKKRVGKTHTVNRNLTPEWGTNLTLSMHTSEFITLRLYHNTSSPFFRDTALGQFTVRMDKLIQLTGSGDGGSDQASQRRIFVHVKPILPEAAVRDVANVASKNLVADWDRSSRTQMLFENR